MNREEMRSRALTIARGGSCPCVDCCERLCNEIIALIGAEAVKIAENKITELERLGFESMSLEEVVTALRELFGVQKP